MANTRFGNDLEGFGLQLCCRAGNKLASPKDMHKKLFILIFALTLTTATLALGQSDSLQTNQNVSKLPRRPKPKAACCKEDVPCTVLAIKTGLLGDLAMIPNIGIEIPLGCHVALTASWHGAWWENTRSCFCWKTYGGDIGLRCYMGDHNIYNRMKGHHLGLNLQGYTFDFCLGRGRNADGNEARTYGIQAPSWNWGADLEYGYRFSIARNLYLDASMGLGALWGTYHLYKPIDTHFVWQATKKHCYWGPTRLELSLVYHIQKGGKRHE